MAEVELKTRLRERGLWPHQADFVATFLAAGAGARFLLADEVGVGKTFSCAACLQELHHEGRTNLRALVVAPNFLVRRWESELKRFEDLRATIVDAPEYRRLESRTPVAESPWMTLQTVITPIDFVKRPIRAEQLMSAPWDIVIIDEAHLCRVGSQRGKLLQLLWESPSVDRMIAVTSTPHSGTPGDFLPLLDPKTRIIRRLAREIIDWDGQPVLALQPNRDVQHVRFQLSQPERLFFEALRTLIRKRAPRSFLGELLLRRATSSLFAVEQSLRQLLARGRESLAGDVIDNDDPSSPLYANEDAPAWSGDEIGTLLALFDEIDSDSKWLKFLELYQSTLSKRSHVLVFVDFADTALYAENSLRSNERPAELLTGSTPPSERAIVLDRFRNEGGTLILTPAAAEGCALGFVKTCVHYDIPWNPGTLAQRFGRIHRINAPVGVVTHYFFVEESEAAVIDKLAGRLAEIKPSFDGIVDDQFLAEVLAGITPRILGERE